MAPIVRGVGKGARQFLRVIGSSSYQNCLIYKNVTEKEISSSSRAMKILTESTTIVQDGIKIEELPILIRRATRDTYPFTSHSYCGDNILREETEFDASFKEMLESCNSVSDVFNLLEVPSDKVQGHSAVYALQRLHILMSLNTDWKQIHSFIRQAVIGELYSIVERDINLLSNFSLITLVDCYFAAEGFSLTCSEAITEEISHRLVEGLFSVEELLSLVQSLKTGIGNAKNKLTGTNSGSSFDKKNNSLGDVLAENASIYLSTGNSEAVEESFNSNNSNSSSSLSSSSHGDYFNYQELLQNVWVHLTSRFSDMDENTLPWTMQLLPSDKKIFIHHLDKRLTHVWSLLSGETASMCLDNLMRLRTHNASMMTKLARWAHINIHLMTQTVLLSFLNVFLHFSFANQSFIHVMERCIAKTGTDTSTDLLALCVEYLRSCRHISPIVMDTAADHFAQHWESYNPLEIFAVLRSFGHLNYLPSKPQNFLFKAEMCLDKRFEILDEVQLLEILASFTFVKVLPKNFYKRITSQHYFEKVGALKNPFKTNALMWLKIVKHAFVMELCHPRSKRHLKWVLNGKSKWGVFLFQDKKTSIIELKSALDEEFGVEHYRIIPYYSCAVIYLDKDKTPIKVAQEGDGPTKPVEKPAARLVILLRSANQVTANTNQLLGAQQQRLDHLKQLGFIPVEIRVGEFHCDSSSNVLKAHLSHLIDFEKQEVAELKGRWVPEMEEKYLKDWLGEWDDGEEKDVAAMKDGYRDLLAALEMNNKDGHIVDNGFAPSLSTSSPSAMEEDKELD